MPTVRLRHTPPATSPPASSERPRPNTGGDTQGIVYYRWPDFLDHFRTKWDPGQHFTLVAPSGEGKSTFAHALLQLRRYVLALDPKGGDPTLAALGWPRLGEWPGRKRLERLVAQNDEEGRPSRFIIGNVAQTTADHLRLTQTIAQCLHDAFEMGKWTVYNDELQVTCDRRMMNLSGPSARLLVAARSKGLTGVQSAQGDSWIIGEAKTQATWYGVGHTQHTETQNDLAGIIGHRREKVRGLMRGLGYGEKGTWLVVNRNPREPIIITRPPYVAPKSSVG